MEKYFIFFQPDKKYNFFFHIQEILSDGYEYTLAEIILFILILTLSIMSIFTSYFIKLMDYTQTILILNRRCPFSLINKKKFAPFPKLR